MAIAAYNVAKNKTGIYVLFLSLIAIYAVARVLQVLPGRIPMAAVVALHLLPPIVFALIHGSRLYRTRGILMFFAICLVIGNIVENIGVRTGFPFGPYYFTDLMGPKLFGVPIMLGLAYPGMAYLSWTLARLIQGGTRISLEWPRIVTLPLIAALIMVCWDLSMDPIWATILRAWIWTQGGAYFGVPVSNFMGWFLNVYLIYQVFALYLRGRATETMPRRYGQMAVLFYAVSAAGNVLLAIPHAGPAVVFDHSGRQWSVSHITGACALVSIFTMGAFALLVWIRLANRQNGVRYWS